MVASVDKVVWGTGFRGTRPGTRLLAQYFGTPLVDQGPIELTRFSTILFCRSREPWRKG